MTHARRRPEGPAREHAPPSEADQARARRLLPARIVQAEAGGDWEAVFRLHRVLAELDGLVPPRPGLARALRRLTEVSSR